MHDMTCPKCHGERHIIKTGGRVVRCDCVAAEITQSSYAAAGVPEIYRDCPESYLSRAVRGTPLEDLSDQRPLLVWVKASGVSSVAEAAISHILRQSVAAGIKTRTISIRDGLEVMFDKEIAPTWKDDLKTAECLLVRVDAGNHKFLPPLFASVLAARRTKKALTVFVSPTDIGKMPGLFGADVSNYFARSKSLVRWAPNGHQLQSATPTEPKP